MHLLRGSEPGLASPDAAGSLVRILFLMAGHGIVLLALPATTRQSLRSRQAHPWEDATLAQLSAPVGTT